MSETLSYPITHIEQVQIEGLWDKFDVDIALNPDVNILFGVNGSGKSSILDIIYKVSIGNQKFTDFASLSRINIKFNNLTLLKIEFIQKAELATVKKRLEKEKLKKSSLEKYLLHKEKLEKLEKEKLEKERLYKYALYNNSLKKEKLEKEKLEKERLLDHESEIYKLNIHNLNKEIFDIDISRIDLLEEERLEKERLEKERLDMESKIKYEHEHELLDDLKFKAKPIDAQVSSNGKNFEFDSQDERLDKYLDIPIQLSKILDIPLNSQESIQKLSDVSIKTDLDWQLWQLEKKYFSYQIDLSKRILATDVEKIDLKTAKEQVYGQKQQFEKIVDQLLSTTHKTIGASDNNSIIFQFKDGTSISAYQLSSGEKQLLILLLIVLLQDQKPAILLLDEPEISLHISWQSQLIQLIRSLNPNCQLIIASHSPSIFGKGWHDKIIRMEEVITATKKEA